MMQLILLPLEPETDNSSRNYSRMRNDAYCLDAPSAVYHEGDAEQIQPGAALY